MIGSGLKKLAQQHGMTVANGVAYGSLMGFATTLSEGADYKRIDIATKFTQPESKNAFMQAVYSVDLKTQFRIQELTVRDAAIAVVFHDTIGTMKKIEEFVAFFYPMLARYGASGANICAVCGAEVTNGGWYMLDGLALHMHDTCAARVQSDLDQNARESKEDDTGSYASGAVGALLGSVLGAILWGIVLSAGYVASLVGFVIGWLAEKGYTLLKGKQGKGKLAILIVAIIFGVLLGTLLPYGVELIKMGFSLESVPEMIFLLISTDAEVSGSVVTNALMGLVFAALGVFGLLRKTGREVATRKLKKLS